MWSGLGRAPGAFPFLPSVGVTLWAPGSWGCGPQRYLGTCSYPAFPDVNRTRNQALCWGIIWGRNPPRAAAALGRACLCLASTVAVPTSHN